MTINDVRKHNQSFVSVPASAVPDIRKRRQQHIIDNIYLNDNKCNALAEDGDIKKKWSGYYSEMLNETKRKSNCCTREKLKDKYLRYQ